MRDLPSVISEAAVGTETYLRLRSESRRGSAEASPYTPSTAQGWIESRYWNGETRYVPQSGPSNDWISHVYDPMDALND